MSKGELSDRERAIGVLDRPLDISDVVLQRLSYRVDLIHNVGGGLCDFATHYYVQLEGKCGAAPMGETAPHPEMAHVVRREPLR